MVISALCVAVPRGVFRWEVAFGAGSVDCLDGSWETDQECGICGEAVTIVCR